MIGNRYWFSPVVYVLSIIVTALIFYFFLGHAFLPAVGLSVLWTTVWELVDLGIHKLRGH